MMTRCNHGDKVYDRDLDHHDEVTVISRCGHGDIKVHNRDLYLHDDSGDIMATSK